MALDRFWICRILTHINAAVPTPPQWIRDAERHLADFLDLDFNILAILQRNKAFVVGAACDQITGIHRHYGRSEFNEFGGNVPSCVEIRSAGVAV